MCNQPVSKKIIIILVTFCAILAVVAAFIVFWDYDRVIDVSKLDLSNMTIQKGTSELDGQIRFNIDNIDQSAKNTVVLQGWLFKNNEEMAIVNNQIVLRDTTDDTYMKISTERVMRPDLDEVFGNGHQYQNGGFYAKISKSYLKKDHDYEVCVLYKSEMSGNIANNNILVLSGSFFEGGKL